MILAKKPKIFQKSQKTFRKTIDKCVLLWYNIIRAVRDAAMAQLVEHMLGKHEVISSTLISSSNTQPLNLLIQGFIFIKLLTNAVPFCYTISNIFWRSRNEKTN